ncbi:peptidase [Arthrobacter sp. Hz1]
MIEVFGGVLHCFQGSGGCRSQGLFFSLVLPRKPVFGTLSPIPGTSADRRDRGAGPPAQEHDLTAIQLSVSNDLAPKIDGAVLDFGDYNNLHRFIWLTLPAVKGPRCTCRRSFGPPAGKRSPCLDDQRLGLSGQ